MLQFYQKLRKLQAIHRTQPLQCGGLPALSAAAVLRAIVRHWHTVVM